MNSTHTLKSRKKSKSAFNIILVFLTILAFAITTSAQNYRIVDTGQVEYYDNDSPIAAPEAGDAFYGQDAQFEGFQPTYQDNGDGTVTDLNTGLMWMQARGEKMSWADAYLMAENLELAGYDDWRLPSIKELYSLILFSGNMGTNEETSSPFLDDSIFDFVYGDTNQGERFIDCQDWSSTQYIAFTMMNDSTVFGVNFADGRIKGYPKYQPGTNNTEPYELYARFVRGNAAYGTNDFIDNGDGTVTDQATGLMWMQEDSDEGLNWEEALQFVQTKNSENYLGHSDWRLPNAKELQSIVDYSRAPDVTESPAIDPVFYVSELEGGEYPFFWTNTTHLDGPPNLQYSKAVYVCFGEANGWMEAPPGSGNFQLFDVHGAGAQRSDFKAGDPDDYPHGNGPQGDVVRINNYVRMVRTADLNTVPDQGNSGATLNSFVLHQNYPNPFNPSTTISFDLRESAQVKLEIFNTNGRLIETLINNTLTTGHHSVEWNMENSNINQLASGLFFYKLQVGLEEQTAQMMLIK